jgi:hypothetical protein
MHNGSTRWACRYVGDHLGERRPGSDGVEYTYYGGLDLLRKATYDEIKRTLQVFHAGRVFEVRILGIKGSGKPHDAAGYFEDPARAARAVLAYEEKQPEGIYFTVNEPDPGVFARSPNRITEYPANAVSDNEIIRRRWLFIDCDPQRPRGISATREQLGAAELLARDCKKCLTEEGFPAPLEACSGNGWYLLYALDLPNDEETKNLIKDVLKAVNLVMGNCFVPGGTPYARVDESTFNAGRVMRLLGTFNRKGCPTTDRPHRRSRLVVAPDKVEVVPLELLRAVADRKPKEDAGRKGKVSAAASPGVPPGGGAVRGCHHRLKVDEWLTANGQTFTVKTTADGRTAYVLGRCPFDPSHGGKGEVCVMQETGGKMSAKCMHDSCSGNGWQAFKGKDRAAPRRPLRPAPKNRVQEINPRRRGG